ncbi:hypothetical protein [Paraburkholderia phytofirmans]|uniref:hypothetical protein n=1 Tax=Paraburkholderia phytofirmans TaxID=261302 RepID=UPI0038BE19E2
MNDVTLHKLNGGAVRLMDPVNGEIGVGEGLETVLGAYMKFRVPVWYCLNRALLSDFVVPEGLGIRVVHIFADEWVASWSAPLALAHRKQSAKAHHALHV